MNEKNLIPNSKRSPTEVRENSRKGGIASGKARREKKTVQKILSELLNAEVKNNPQFAKLAQKLGVENDKSVKEIFTAVCLLNTVKDGNLADLERLVKLLGENDETAGENVIRKLDEVIKGIDVIADE